VTICAGANGLRQHDAVGDALGRRPIVSVFATHVDDGKARVDLSSVFGNIPTVDSAAPKIDIRDQPSVFPVGCIKQLNGILARSSYSCLEPAINKAFFDDARNKMVSSTTKIIGRFFHHAIAPVSAWLPAHYGRSKEFVLKWQNSLGRGIMAQTPQGAGRDPPGGLGRYLTSFGYNACGRRTAKRNEIGLRERAAGKTDGFGGFRKYHRR
jgi:hypothetical protein